MQASLPASVVRELDRAAIEDRGVHSLLLMENAGRAVADVVAARLVVGGAPAVVLVGPGNNGGDGLVVARTLVNRGFAARVYFVGALERLRDLSPDTQANVRAWRDLERAGLPVGSGRLVEVRRPSDLGAALAGALVVVDALFGTGLARPLMTPWREVVEAVNAVSSERELAVVAVDVPSGLHADRGEVLGAAIRATETVTFVAPKPGLLLGAGPTHAGRLTVAEIGIPRDLVLAAYERGSDV